MANVTQVQRENSQIQDAKELEWQMFTDHLPLLYIILSNSKADNAMFILCISATWKNCYLT